MLKFRNSVVKETYFAFTNILSDLTCSALCRIPNKYEDIFVWISYHIGQLQILLYVTSLMNTYISHVSYIVAQIFAYLKVRDLKRILVYYSILSDYQTLDKKGTQINFSVYWFKSQQILLHYIFAIY
jgi:hypothetical protein